MPFDRSKYPPDWKAISLRIRAREGNRCKWCKVQNGIMVVRSLDGSVFMTHDGSEGRVYRATDGGYVGNADLMGPALPELRNRATKIVLTVAHIDHDPTNNADQNLAALCQFHHLGWDRGQHTESARRNRRARLAARDLFE